MGFLATYYDLVAQLVGVATTVLLRKSFVNVTLSSVPSHLKKSKWILKVFRAFLPIQLGSSNMWLRYSMRVDAGTSILLQAQVSADFHAQTVLEAVIDFLQTYGCPRQLTFDRDPRFVGGTTGGDFPSPLIQFLLCLGIQPNVCPPHRPDKNAFVERYNRTYTQECLQVFHPQTLEQVLARHGELPGSLQY